MCGKVALWSTGRCVDLVLRTPRLELRPDDDAGLDELVAVAYGGRAPARGDAVRRGRGPTPIRATWVAASCSTSGRQRAALAPQRWSVHFLVRLDGRVIGTQKLGAGDFAITREVHTGSWIGLRHQGQGIGTEMRAAVVLFAFDHLGAQVARSAANAENPASLGVSGGSATGRDGTETVVRRGRRAEDVRLRRHAGDPFVRRTGRWRWRGTPRSAAPCSAGSAEVDAAGERVALRRVAGL